MEGSPDQKLKSYWNRPGGPIKVLVGLGALVFFGAYAAPFLTNVVWNTVNFGIALGAFGLFIFLVTNKQLRLAVLAVWDILMKYTFGFIFQWDPFVIAEQDIKDMEIQREKARDQAIEVDTQKETIQMKIDEKNKELTRLVAKGQAAKKNNMMDEIGLISDTITGYKEYIQQLSPMLANLTNISIFLTKFDENSGRTIERAKTQLGLKKDLFKSVTAGNKAITATMRFFKGDPEKKLLLEQSMDAFRVDIASKLANMKKAISVSSVYMRSIDLDKATSEEQGLKLLESINPDKDFSIEVPDELLPKREVGKVQTSYYDNLLN